MQMKITWSTSYAIELDSEEKPTHACASLARPVSYKAEDLVHTYKNKSYFLGGTILGIFIMFLCGLNDHLGTIHTAKFMQVLQKTNKSW